MGANQLHYRTVLHCQTYASSLIAVVGHWFDHCRVPLSPCLSWSDTKKGQRHPLGCRQHRSTPTRFELARAEPIGFQNQLLNHSDTLSTHSLSGLTTETYEKGVRVLGFTLPWRPKKEPDAGLEPAASRLRACHSTD